VIPKHSIKYFFIKATIKYDPHKNLVKFAARSNFRHFSSAMKVAHPNKGSRIARASWDFVNRDKVIITSSTESIVWNLLQNKQMNQHQLP